MNRNTKPHVVIVGGGFGGLQVARHLKKVNCQVTLIDRNNHHLFQPLLYQVATGGLSEANIAVPLRSVLRKHKNCETLMAEVVDFDIANKKVLLLDGEVAYDYLVVAAGAVTSYFGNDHFAQYAPGLKSLDDAREVRTRIFAAFEAAEREKNLELRKPWMNFVVVGGGPTGVELAGAISEIARKTLIKDFRHINPADAQIILVEGSDRVLGPFDPKLSTFAKESLESMGVQVMTSARVTNVEQDKVTVDQDGKEVSIPTWTVIWGAGVQGNKLGAKLAAATGVEAVRGGRVPITTQLCIEGHSDVFALGDIASGKDKNDVPIPGLAAAAMQQGSWLAKHLTNLIEGKASDEQFAYNNKGTMATIGKNSAIVQVGEKQMSGFFAWMTWMGLHLLLLVQFRSRTLVFLQWVWSYLTFSRSSRLILGVKKVAIPGREISRDEPDAS